MSRHIIRRSLLAAATAITTGAVTALTAGAAGAAATEPTAPPPTIVLVHGAFADSSGWADVIAALTADGYPVYAPANPLRGVPGDAAYLRSFLATIEGPIVLVGHSYGGFVMTNAAVDNPNVTALVYVAAFAPAEGDTVGGLGAQFPGGIGPDALTIRPYALDDGTESADGYISLDVFHEVFAADLPAETAAVMAASQRPSDANALGQPSGPPAWESIPSWFVIPTADHAIPAEAQRFMAERAGAVDVVEVDASHVVMISQPDVVTAAIVAAATAS